VKARRPREVIIGTVAGEIHDIGKDRVAVVLDVNGCELIDRGIDVPVQKWVDTIKEPGTEVAGLSGFLTLAFDSIKETVDAIKQVGVRGEIKIIA
jgi:methanogenic corrinoid protein MtbC1